MKDDKKTREQLIQELAELRMQNASPKKSESAEKYRDLVESLKDVIYELDCQGVVLYISPAIRDLLGFDSDEIVGKNFVDFAHKDDLSGLTEWFSELRKGKESPSEYRVIDKSGGHKWALTRVKTIMEDGQFKGARGILIDVTEQKRTDRMLRESEEKYRHVFENSIMGISQTLRDGRFIVVNNAFAKMYGYATAEEMMTQVSSIGPLYANPEEREEVLRILTEKGVMEPREITVIHRNGTRFTVLAGVREIRDFKGNLLYYQAEQIDITERKRAEDTLRESEKKYRWVLNNMADVITVMDMNLRFTYVSPSIMNFRGYTADEAVGQTLEQVMTPESLQVSAKAFEEEMKLEAGGKADPDRIRIVEAEQYRKDGSIVLMENHLSFMRDEAKKPVGIISVSHDITSRKRAEVNLKESKELTEAIVENVPLMIFLKDAVDLRFIIFNRAGEELLGYDRKALLGKSDLNLFPPEQAVHFMAKDREVLDGESGILDIPEEPILTAKKGQRLLHTKKVCIKGADGATKYLLGISEDITERKLAEKQLQDTLDSLRKAVGATIQVMASAVEARDPYTAGHQIRVADLARAIAAEMGLPQEQIDGLHMAGSIHDIGKLSIPAEILSKPTKLSEIEFSLIKEHAQHGYEILRNVESSWPLAEIVRQHHERMDGSGYPQKLKGEEILMEARILAVADVVEAMASHRPYRPGLGINAALKEIEKNKGIFYDQAVADACLRLFREKGFKLEGI